MLKTVFVGLTKKLSAEEAFLLQAKGQMSGAKDSWAAEREKDEAELDALIEDGWTLFHAHEVNDSHGVSIAYIMHKPKQVPTWSHE